MIIFSRFVGIFVYYNFLVGWRSRVGSCPVNPSMRTDCTSAKLLIIIAKLLLYLLAFVQLASSLARVFRLSNRSSAVGPIK